MNKKYDISKILAKGSAKQRALLYFNNIGEKNRQPGTGKDIERAGKGFLTEAEEHQLHASFKTDADIRLYNRYNKLLKTIYNKTTALAAMLFQYRETIASLTGYCLLYHGYTEFADTLSGLYFEMKTPEEKKKVLTYLEKHKRYLWAEIGPGEDPDTDGIRLLPGYDLPKGKDRKAAKIPRQTPKIRDVVEAYSKRAKKQLGENKAVVKALRDMIAETGFKVEEQIDGIDRIDNDLKEDKAPLPKFSREKTEAGLLTGDDMKKKKQLEEIFGPNWLFPEYDAVEMDEELYNTTVREIKKWAEL
jgi:hypothetical protein